MKRQGQRGPEGRFGPGREQVRNLLIHLANWFLDLCLSPPSGSGGSWIGKNFMERCNGRFVNFMHGFPVRSARRFGFSELCVHPDDQSGKLPPDSV